MVMRKYGFDYLVEKNNIILEGKSNQFYLSLLDEYDHLSKFKSEVFDKIDRKQIKRIPSTGSYYAATFALQVMWDVDNMSDVSGRVNEYIKSNFDDYTKHFGDQTGSAQAKRLFCVYHYAATSIDEIGKDKISKLTDPELLKRFVDITLEWMKEKSIGKSARPENLFYSSGQINFERKPDFDDDIDKEESSSIDPELDELKSKWKNSEKIPKRRINDFIDALGLNDMDEFNEFLSLAHVMSPLARKLERLYKRLDTNDMKMSMGSTNTYEMSDDEYEDQIEGENRERHIAVTDTIETLKYEAESYRNPSDRYERRSDTPTDLLSQSPETYDLLLKRFREKYSDPAKFTEENLKKFLSIFEKSKFKSLAEIINKNVEEQLLLQRDDSDIDHDISKDIDLTLGADNRSDFYPFAEEGIELIIRKNMMSESNIKTLFDNWYKTSPVRSGRDAYTNSPAERFEKYKKLKREQRINNQHSRERILSGKDTAYHRATSLPEIIERIKFDISALMRDLSDENIKENKPSKAQIKEWESDLKALKYKLFERERELNIHIRGNKKYKKSQGLDEDSEYSEDMSEDEEVFGYMAEQVKKDSHINTIGEFVDRGYKKRPNYSVWSF
jgi:hypothetical protein